MPRKPMEGECPSPQLPKHDFRVLTDSLQAPPPLGIENDNLASPARRRTWNKHPSGQIIVSCDQGVSMETNQAVRVTAVLRAIITVHL